MSNAQEIITEIDGFLDRAMLKKSKITNADVIRFIEEKWAQADAEKYDIHQGSIIIARMNNEYIRLKDYPNLQRWLDEMDKHALSRKHPAYINNYYNGACCLECGNEEKALEYLRLSYAESPEYLFTRAPFVAEFFKRALGLPARGDTHDAEDEDDADDAHAADDARDAQRGERIVLADWQTFFDEDLTDLYCEPGENGRRKNAGTLTAGHKRGLAYLREHASQILQAMLKALLKRYPALQADYGYTGADKRDFMPDVKDIQGFADLLSPTCVYAMSVYKDKFPYMGYAFSCAWDREHGLGFMMYKNKVVEIGGADTAFLRWVAENDLKK